jgi:DHA1 family multidrug resistance protein-like MFS transporter
VRRFLRYLQASIPPGADGQVWWLTLVASMGVTAVLPVLPLYAHANGADLAFIGWMVGAYMAANLATLYGAGWLSDRWGRKPMMAIGMWLMALASVGFVLFPHPVAMAGLRALEGVAAACLLPVALAYVADRAPEHERGRRMAQLAVAENMGLLLGPMVGGVLIATLGLASPFWVLGVACTVGAVLVHRLPAATPLHHGPEGRAAPDDWGAVRWALAAGLATRAMATGFSIGLYETIWSIFIQDRGGNAWHISLTWTLFAVPAILLGPFAGRFIDRVGPAQAAVGGAVFQALVVASYAAVPTVEGLVALTMLEGVGFAFLYPAFNALQVHAAPMALRGRMLGAIWAFRTVGALAGAVVTPRLYGLGPAWCFGVTSVILMMGAIGLAIALSISQRRESGLPGASPGQAA